jgi:hypothetical protein
MRSVKARQISGAAGAKNLNPLNKACGGLCFANKVGRGVLRGDRHPALTVYFVEGETDFLAAVSRAGDAAIFGIYSGGWSDDHAAAVAAGVGELKLVYLLDKDLAGRRYRKIIEDSFNSVEDE